jgi:hypothetical protein
MVFECTAAPLILGKAQNSMGALCHMGNGGFAKNDEEALRWCFCFCSAHMAEECNGCLCKGTSLLPIKTTWTPCKIEMMISVNCSGVMMQTCPASFAHHDNNSFVGLTSRTFMRTAWDASKTWPKRFDGWTAMQRRRVSLSLSSPCFDRISPHVTSHL